jgi:hypothetical protein
MRSDIDLLVTMWPTFPHFRRFAYDKTVWGVRLNSAMIGPEQLAKEMATVRSMPGAAPVFFDVKSRQPRIIEVLPNKEYLDIRLNHPISLFTGSLPAPVILKGGSDVAELGGLLEGGRRLVFTKNPRFKVKPGESLCIRAPHYVEGGLFTDAEREKISLVRAAGITRFFLSYVEKQADVDEFRELVGQDAEVWLKVENERGLDFVANDFVKDDRTTLVAARGDLYVELDRPHDVAEALRLIVGKDPKACAASRIMLSVVDKVSATETLWKYVDEKDNVFFTSRREVSPVFSPFTGKRVDQLPVKTYLNDNSKVTCNPVPSCSDFLELDWLYRVGYRRFMLCDEMCLREDLLGTAVGAFNAFRSTL